MKSTKTGRPSSSAACKAAGDQASAALTSAGARSSSGEAATAYAPAPRIKAKAMRPFDVALPNCRRPYKTKAIAKSAAAKR